MTVGHYFVKQTPEQQAQEKRDAQQQTQNPPPPADTSGERPFRYPNGEAVFNYMALLKDGQYIPIPHPCETEALADHGETMSSARKKNALFCLDPHLCMDCGEVIYQPRLDRGCLSHIIDALFFVFPFVAGTMLGIFFGIKYMFNLMGVYTYWAIGPVTFIFCFFTFGLFVHLSIYVQTQIIHFIDRMRAPKNRLRIHACPTCHGTKFLDFASNMKSNITLKDGTLVILDTGVTVMS